MYQYRCVTYTTVFIPNLMRILIHTRYCPVLDCTVFVLDLYWILSYDTKMVLFSTIFLQLISNSTVLVSTFWWISKNCTNTVLFGTIFMQLATDCSLYWSCAVYCMMIQKWYCPVPYCYSLYRAVLFFYRLSTGCQRPVPKRYCSVPCLYRFYSTGIRYWNGIGTLCKMVQFGTIPIPCTGNMVPGRYQFLSYNGIGTVQSSTGMFTG